MAAWLVAMAGLTPVPPHMEPLFRLPDLDEPRRERWSPERRQRAAEKRARKAARRLAGGAR